MIGYLGSIQPNHAAAGNGEQPFDAMNSIAANLLLHLTASGASWRSLIRDSCTLVPHAVRLR